MSHSDDLDEFLAGPEPDWEADPEPAQDMAQADRWLRHLAHLDHEDERDGAFAAHEMDRIGAWLADRKAPRAKRRAWLQRSLEQWWRAEQGGPKAPKSTTLPGGKVSMRKQPAVWSIDPDQFVVWARTSAPELLHQRPAPDPTPDRDAIKRAARVVDGIALIAGEIVPGVSVEDREDAVTIVPTPIGGEA